MQLKPLRELEVVEGEYDEVIQGHIQPKNKDNYIHFKLKNMSHISDPMIHLKQLFPNTLALSNIKMRAFTSDTNTTTRRPNYY